MSSNAVKQVPPAVAQFMLQERRQNTELREKIDRLLKAARSVNEGAVVADGGCCEVDLEDMQALEAALKEWGK